MWGEPVYTKRRFIIEYQQSLRIINEALYKLQQCTIEQWEELSKYICDRIEQGRGEIVLPANELYTVRTMIEINQIIEDNGLKEYMPIGKLIDKATCWLNSKSGTYIELLMKDSKEMTCKYSNGTSEIHIYGSES